MAELRNPTADRWDFDRGYRELRLGPCFPRGISHADVDSETEINGRWLVIEGKRAHERLQGGQLYTNRARVREGRTVLIVYGDPPYDVVAMQHFRWGADDGIEPASLADVHRFCSEWARWAESDRRAAA